MDILHSYSDIPILLTLKVHYDSVASGDEDRFKK